MVKSVSFICKSSWSVELATLKALTIESSEYFFRVILPVPRAISSLNLIIIWGFSVSNEFDPLDGVVPMMSSTWSLLPVENHILPDFWYSGWIPWKYAPEEEDLILPGLIWTTYFVLSVILGPILIVIFVLSSEKLTLSDLSKLYVATFFRLLPLILWRITLLFLLTSSTAILKFNSKSRLLPWETSKLFGE